MTFELTPRFSNFRVRYGGVCLRAGGNCKQPDQKVATIRRAVVSKTYVKERCMPQYDIAILELEDEIKFDSYTRPLCLPNANLESMSPVSFFIYGFGDDENLNQVSRLQFAPLNYIEVVEDVILAWPKFNVVKMMSSGICDVSTFNERPAEEIMDFRIQLIAPDYIRKCLRKMSVNRKG